MCSQIDEAKSSLPREPRLELIEGPQTTKIEETPAGTAEVDLDACKVLAVNISASGDLLNAALKQADRDRSSWLGKGDQTILHQPISNFVLA
jgi:hypothetical protein